MAAHTRTTFHETPPSDGDDHLIVGLHTTGDDKTVVRVAVSGGVSLWFNPETTRALAEHLVEMADKAEEMNA